MRTNLAPNGALCLHPYLWGVIHEYSYKHALENNHKCCFIVTWLKLEEHTLLLYIEWANTVY